jgi:enoyl-CoA hydratase/carnithine racemase
MGQYCQAERDGHLLVVTIDRPEVMNALHPPGNSELAEVFDDFAADPELWVAIITGAGDRAFSAGNDLKYQASGGDRSGQPAAGFGGITARYDLTKPVIAAVNGIAMGGGFEIALACDIIIASENAVFALPEVRVGLAALAGGVHRLPRAIGVQQALGMILTGRRVPAAEGQALGFVNEVVPEGQALAGARRWAEQILEASPMSVRASKQAALRGLEHAGVQAASAASYSAVQDMVRSEDFIEGPRAFAEKRPPQWKGR